MRNTPRRNVTPGMQLKLDKQLAEHRARVAAITATERELLDAVRSIRSACIGTGWWETSSLAKFIERTGKRVGDLKVSRLIEIIRQHERYLERSGIKREMALALMHEKH